MLKVLIKIIRVIIILYLFMLTFIALIIYSKKNTFGEISPTILDYSYIKIDSELFEPDIKKGSLVLLKKSKYYELNDFVLVKGESKNNLVLRKIISKDGNKLKLDIVNNIDGKDYVIECYSEDVLLKMVYNNDIFSFIVKLLINPIFILIMLFVGTILPELLFND